VRRVTVKNKRRLVWNFGVILGLVFVDSFATAGVEIVEIAKVKVVGQLSGEVRDPSGAPLSGATVEEVSPDWKIVFQNTKTDTEGHFAMTPSTRRRLYYVVVTLPGFNSVRMRVRIDASSTKQLDIQLPLGT
jgi:hypothetical protein